MTNPYRSPRSDDVPTADLSPAADATEPSRDAEAAVLESLFEYFEAIKIADYDRVERVSTPKFFRSLGIGLKFSLWVTRWLTPWRLSNLQPENIRVDFAGENRVSVEYAIQIGRRRVYERVAMIRDDSRWLMDGKVT